MRGVAGLCAAKEVNSASVVGGKKCSHVPSVVERLSGVVCVVVSVVVGVEVCASVVLVLGGSGL